MDPFATSHFSHDALLHDFKTLDERDVRNAAVLLSRVVEIDERKLFLREGYPSMRAYCIQARHWCEGTASRRIYAARTARRFPLLFVALADGRLHLTAVLMLAKYLRSGNVDELVATATHKSRAEIELLIAERFPRPDLPETVRAIASSTTSILPALQGEQPEPAPQHSPENARAPITPGSLPIPAIPGPALQHSPENAEAPIAPIQPHIQVPAPEHAPENARPRVPRIEPKPLAPQRYAYQCTMDQETHDLLQRARDLMGHQSLTGDGPPVLKCALRMWVAHLEKQKYAATDRPRAAQPGRSTRHIAAAVKRAVAARDEGQCAFVSETGHRCTARDTLQFDHIEPVARGGQATVENMRLLCRAHNAYAAEGVFGVEFMERKRAEGRRGP